MKRLIGLAMAVLVMCGSTLAACRRVHHDRSWQQYRDLSNSAAHQCDDFIREDDKRRRSSDGRSLFHISKDRIRKQRQRGGGPGNLEAVAQDF